MFHFVLLAVLFSSTLAKPSGIATVGQYSAPSYVLLTSSVPQAAQQITPLKPTAPISGSLQILSPTLTPVTYAAQQLQSIAPLPYAGHVLANLNAGARILAAPVASAPASTILGVAAPVASAPAPTILGVAAPTISLQTVTSSVPDATQQEVTAPALPATAYTVPGPSVGLLSLPAGASDIKLKYGSPVSNFAAALPAGFASSTLW